MATVRTIADPILPYLFAANESYAIREFMLFDVGASGGIEPYWPCFGQALQAVGFDPIVAEVARLNQQNTLPGVRYEEAFVGCADFDRLFPETERQDRIRTKNNFSFEGTSAIQGLRAAGKNFESEHYNQGKPIELTARRISLDDYAAGNGIRGVDFVKIDTDGHDIEVILGARKMLASAGVLGLSVEVQFHGGVHPYSNTFTNIDRILREDGYTLFDLDTWRYSRAALPDRFYYPLPAQTVSGQLQWGEAVYFRDLADADYERMHGMRATAEQMVKLACLYELFGLPDCSAQVLVVLRDQTKDAFFTTLLDALVARYRKTRENYEQFQRRFYANPMEFLPAADEPERRGWKWPWNRK